ncbi:MAG: LON peptidase substrate-binding domain-containing protein, partial [Bacilli bacterium]
MMKTNLPVIVLRGIIMLPYAELKIDLIDEVDMKIIDLSNDNHDGYVLLSSPENYLEESLNIKDLPSLGVVGKIVKRIVLPNGSVRICVEGIKRATVNKYMPYEGVNNVFASEISSPTRYAIDARDEAALVRKLKTELEKYISLVPYASNSILAVTQQINSVSKLSDVISNYLPLTFERKYEYLKMVNPHARVMMNLEDIQKELDIYEIESKIDANLKMGLDKSQKEFILREKIKLIKEELGDISSKDDDVEVLTNQIKKLKAPLNIIKKLEKELKKYESTPSASPEISIIRNYLDVIIIIHWNKYKKD